MGSCCSCCMGDDEGQGGSGGKETEMTQQSAEAVRSLTISRAMTSPTVEVETGNRVRDGRHELIDE